LCAEGKLVQKEADTGGPITCVRAIASSVVIEGD